MFFLLLAIWAEELRSTPKIITFWPNPPPGNEKLPLLSNPIPLPEYLYFLMSAFFVKVTAPNKHFFSVGSLSLELEAHRQYNKHNIQIINNQAHKQYKRLICVHNHM